MSNGRQNQNCFDSYENKKKEREKASDPFRRLSLKAKLILVAVTACIAIGIFGFVLPWLTDDHETHYLTTSDLISAVDIDNLSAIDYLYHGIAEKKGKLLWMDHVDYRVKYEAHIRAHYTMSDIRFEIDEDDKNVTVYIPEPQIDEPQLDSNEFGYLPESAKADMKDVIALCREDAKNDINIDEIKTQAEESLQDTIKALTLPLIGDGYQLEFKPISEYVEGADLDA